MPWPKGKPRPKGTARHGNGAGWGGSAKGASVAPPLSADDDHRGQHNAARIVAKEDRIARLVAHLEHLAFSAENEGTQVQAADKALDRLEGKAIARQITADANDVDKLSDAELIANIERVSRALGISVVGLGDATAGKPAGDVPAIPEAG